MKDVVKKVEHDVPCHRALTVEEQRLFVELVTYAVSKDRMFRVLISYGSVTIVGWSVFIMMFTICTFILSADRTDTLHHHHHHYHHQFPHDNNNNNNGMFHWCIGFMMLQIFFIATHVSAHGSFFEYLNFRVGNARLGNAPLIKLAAFVHHHINVKGMGEWIPFFSYTADHSLLSPASRRKITRTTKKNGADQLSKSHPHSSGWNNIVAAHWSGYSSLSKPHVASLVYFVLLPFMCSRFGLDYWAVMRIVSGYECAVLFLPYAHGWEHIPPNLFPFVVRHTLHALEWIGVIWSRRQHSGHHDYSSFEVYQDFGSSGLSMFVLRKLDPLITRWYRLQFRDALKLKVYVADLIEPCERAICILLVLGVPILALFYVDPLLLFMFLFIAPALVMLAHHLRKPHILSGFLEHVTYSFF